jgi:hypothetical protein
VTLDNKEDGTWTFFAKEEKEEDTTLELAKDDSMLEAADMAEEG